MMSKIFNVSLHRSGTQSFARFCRKAGISVQHWPGEKFTAECAFALQHCDRDFVWERYCTYINRKNAFVDVPVPFVYQQAYRRFPDAKFILILRPTGEWIRSVRKHTKDRELDVLERLLYWSLSERRAPRLEQYSDDELCSVYFTHVAEVTNFLCSNHAAFQINFLKDPKLGAKLGAFLEIDSLEIPFENYDAMRSRSSYLKEDPK